MYFCSYKWNGLTFPAVLKSFHRGKKTTNIHKTQQSLDMYRYTYTHTSDEPGTVSLQKPVLLLECYLYTVAKLMVLLFRNIQDSMVFLSYTGTLITVCPYLLGERSFFCSSQCPNLWAFLSLPSLFFVSFCHYCSILLDGWYSISCPKQCLWQQSSCLAPPSKSSWLMPGKPITLVFF